MSLERSDLRRGRAAMAMLVVAIVMATALAVALVIGAVADGSGSAGRHGPSLVSMAAILAAPLRQIA